MMNSSRNENKVKLNLRAEYSAPSSWATSSTSRTRAENEARRIPDSQEIPEDQVDDVFVNMNIRGSMNQDPSTSKDHHRKESGEPNRAPGILKQCSSFASDDSSLQLSISPSSSLTTVSMNSNDNQAINKDTSFSMNENTNKVGLEHLNNLCKLMEQFCELKEANSFLQRKVQYLEDMRSIHDEELNNNNNMKVQKLNIHSSASPNPSINQTEDKSENLFLHSTEYSNPRKYVSNNKNIIRGSAKERRFAVHKSKSQVIVPGVSTLNRERSKSVGNEEVLSTKGKGLESDSKTSSTKGSKRFPKWSKVKEALGFEKRIDIEQQIEDNYPNLSCRDTVVKGKRHTKDLLKGFEDNIPAYLVEEGFDLSDCDDLNRDGEYPSGGHISADEVLVRESSGNYYII